MSEFYQDLSLALKVMGRWETLAALALFIIVWSLFRYVALVRNRSPGLRFRLAQRLARREAPKPEALPEEQRDGFEEEE